MPLLFDYLLKHRLDLAAVDLAVQIQRNQQADYLRNGERPPDRMDIAGETQQVSGGQQYDQLAAQGGNGRIQAVAHGRECGTAQSNTHSCQGEHQADRPQSTDTHLHKSAFSRICLCAEKAHQHIRDQLENQHAQQHDHHGGTNGPLQCAGDPLRLPRAVVKCQNGNGCIVDAKQGHKEETLELEINTKHTGSCFSHTFKAQEDLIHAKVHHRSDGHHDDGRNTYCQDLSHDLLIRPQILHLELHIGILCQIENH